MYRRLDGPQGRSVRAQKITLPPGLDPQTVKPVASRYTDYAIPPDTGSTFLQNAGELIYYTAQKPKRQSVSEHPNYIKISI